GILRARPTRLEHGGVFLKISTKGLYENFHLGCANAGGLGRTFSTMARIISGSENVAAELSKMNFASK
ncbi:hypothetical protein L916_00724, partial [Phytophthora nicotianae]